LRKGGAGKRSENPSECHLKKSKSSNQGESPHFKNSNDQFDASKIRAVAHLGTAHNGAADATP